jgi:outer membrane protein assembly factor BamB
VRTKVRFWVALVVSVAALVACSPTSQSVQPAGSSDAAGSSASRSAGEGAPATSAVLSVPAKDRWESSGLAVHSQLSATRDSVVYAGVQNDELQVVALDTERGTERWRRSSDVSKRVRGVELAIFTDEDTAFFLTRGGSGTNPVSYRSGGAGSPSGDTLSLTAVTTATGQERWSTLLQGEADPNAQACGTSVCLFVTAGRKQQLWSFDRSTGRIENKADISLPGGPGDDAVITGLGGDHDVSSFISASRGPVVISQYSAQGSHLDWSQPVDQLYDRESVSPNGGWAGWPAGDGGWVIWLGTGERSPSQPKAGDTFARGAVAGVSRDGSHL